MSDLHSATPMMPTQEVKQPPRRQLILYSLHVTTIERTSGATEAEWPRTTACSRPMGQVLLAFESSFGRLLDTTCDLSFEQPATLGGGSRERLEDAAAGGLQLGVPSGCRAQGAASERKCDGRRCSQHARCVVTGGVARVEFGRGIVWSSLCGRFFERHGRVNAAQRSQQPHETSVRHAAKNQPKAREITAYERIVRQSFRIRGLCLGVGSRRQRWQQKRLRG